MPFFFRLLKKRDEKLVPFPFSSLVLFPIFRSLSCDHDPLFRFERWRTNLRILDVDEIKTVPYVPLSHPFVERLIRILRRERLGRTLFWTSVDLENKLLEFRNYFNRYCTHTSLEGRTPDQDTSVSRPLADLHSYRWRPYCQGLYQTPVAARYFKDSRSLSHAMDSLK